MIAKVLKKDFVTQDTVRLLIEKPEGYNFIPGQATDISINKEGWKEEKRPFTFTSLNKDKVLELTIKIYSGHNGVTKEINKLNPGDELSIQDPWGAINYKGEGVFIAGGAGITPFISIIRNLVDKNALDGNKLLFSNKTKKDIILEKEFEQYFNKNFINFLTEENSKESYIKGRIDKDKLEENIEDFSRFFYICGPPAFVKAIKSFLLELGAEENKIVTEGF
ncbi:MAG: FAD-binding oxidoreductase [Nanobdellota archaeon]